MRSPLALALLLGIATCGGTAVGAPPAAPAAPGTIAIGGGGAIDAAIEDGPLDVSRAGLQARHHRARPLSGRSPR